MPRYIDDPLERRAGFGARFAAWFIDGVLYLLLFSVFLVVGLGIGGIGTKDCRDQPGDGGAVVCTADEVNGPLLFLGIVVIAAGAIVVLGIYCSQLGRTGQTWGRRIRGLRVVDRVSEEPIGFARAIGRTLFANIVSASLCYLGYLWMLWDKEKQTWHDRVIDTIVIQE